jgi:sortase (surface protein transpeptidase)
VLDGHLDWTSGPAVFWHLAQLGAGDQVIVVAANGTQVNFVVDSTVVFPFDAAPQGLFTKTGAPSIALVTCSGPWDRQRGTYVDRLVVHATLAPPAPPEPPGDEGG